MILFIPFPAPGTILPFSILRILFINVEECVCRVLVSKICIVLVTYHEAIPPCWRFVRTLQVKVLGELHLIIAPHRLTHVKRSRRVETHHGVGEVRPWQVHGSVYGNLQTYRQGLVTFRSITKPIISKRW